MKTHPLSFPKTDPAYFARHRTATFGAGRVLAEKLATQLVQLELHDMNLRVRYDARVKPEDGGRYCVFEFVKEPYNRAAAATDPNYKPFVGYRRIYIIEDPNGGFTMPDRFVVKHLKNMRELAADFLRSDNESDIPSVILNPHAS